MNKSNLTFSIVLPVYNREKLILQSLDCIKQQTYRPIQLIIVDDGSTDNTKEVVEQWAKKNEEENQLVVHYKHQRNAGPSAARNEGIDAVEGKYVQFFDSDDFMHPNRLAVLAETFEKQQADFIQTGFEGFDADTNEIIQTNFGKPGEDQFELALKGRFWANTLRAALTTELVKRVGYWNTEMTCFEDREYMERAVAIAEKPVAIREVLASARRGGGARISDKLKSYEGRTWRIHCEARLAKFLKEKQAEVSEDAKRAFVSRIYALGFRSNAMGWTDLGKRCGEIVKDIPVQLDWKGKKRYWVWRSGKLGGWLHVKLAALLK